MSMLDQEIIEQLQGLDDSQKAQVLEFIRELHHQPEPKAMQWLETAHALRKEQQAKYGDYHFQIRKNAG